MTFSFSEAVKCAGSATGVTTNLAGVASFALLGSDTFPAASVAVAVTFPAGSGFVGVIVATPSSFALPSPISLPSLSSNLTVDPGSASTVTGSVVPSFPVRSVVITGACGFVVSSGAFGVVASFALLGSDTFPAASVAVAVTFPAGSGFVGVIVATPSSFALPSPISLPSLSSNLTVDPGSASTVTGSVVPSFPVRSVVITGACGFVVSVSITLTGTVTSSVVPSGYVTNTTPVVSPFAVVVGSVFHATCVFSGNFLSLAILAFASGTTPLSTVCGTGVGLYVAF